MFHRAGGCLSVRGAVRGSAPEWNGRYIDYKSPIKVMKFFRVPANTLPRWKIALYRPSCASSVRWLSFFPFFFLKERPLCHSKPSRQLPLPDHRPAALLISTEELLPFPLPLLQCSPSAPQEAPASPEALFLQRHSTRRPQILAHERT